MTDLIVHPSKISGEIEIPSSKSHSIRAILFASLASGTSYIFKILNSPDIHYAIKACRQFGAEIEEKGEDLVIRGTGGTFNTPHEEINAGNSGQILRFIGALAALGEGKAVLTGDNSIQENRPALPLLKALKQLGAEAISLKNNGFAPIQVKGPAKPGHVHMEGSDSQPVSGMLILSAFLDGETEIEVINPGEKPWIDLTLYWLNKFRIPYENEGYSRYKVYGKRVHSAFEYTVPGDFSSAAFPAIAALIAGGEVVLKNIDMEDPQGDKELFEVLKKMGANIVYNANDKELKIYKNEKNLVGKRLDINAYIDSITILSVLGCFVQGELLIENAGIARRKESDRIAVIAKELKKMGAIVHEKKEGLIIRSTPLKGAILNSYHDHRVAMSLIIAALNAKGKSIIHSVDCIVKSYPSFIEDMKKLGANLEVM